MEQLQYIDHADPMVLLGNIDLKQALNKHTVVMFAIVPHGHHRNFSWPSKGEFSHLSLESAPRDQSKCVCNTVCIYHMHQVANYRITT